MIHYTSVNNTFTDICAGAFTHRMEIKMTNVLVVEDQRMPRENIERILADSKRYRLVASIGDASLALMSCRRHPVELVLMDVCTAGSKDGILAAAEIKEWKPQIKIIIITSMVEAGFLKRAKEAAVDSFWYKDISKEELIDVIDRTMAGEHIFPKKTPCIKIGLASSDELTPTEIEVLRCICDGLEYDEIASIRGITVNTVKYHVSNILQKTGYANKTRLAIAATNQKFIIPKLPEDMEI